jgi:serine/threonine-protein phosphatase 2A regulatory subunit B''
MPQSDTWEPLPEEERQGDDAGGDNPNHPNNSGGTTSNGTSINGVGEALLSEHNPMNTHDAMMNQGGNAAMMMCVRDQVQAVFADMGHLLQDRTTATAADEDADDDETGKEDLANTCITVLEFVRITKDIFRFPTFFNVPLCQRLLWLWRQHKSLEQTLEEPAPDEPITYEMVEWYWRREMEPYDYQERFFRLCKQPESEYIVRDDFLPFIKALLNDHPASTILCIPLLVQYHDLFINTFFMLSCIQGLEFLSNHAEFQEKYAVTVITRIFYSVNKCHSGRITCRQIRRSDLLDAFMQVDEEEDINKVTRYFSYEHFYVLYCRFWELDHDRDYRITREDLLKYGDHSLSLMIVDRIFDAAPRPFEEPSALDALDEDGQPASPSLNRQFLSYEDFIYFMLSEEDKANEVSVRYWFTCVDGEF